MAHSTRLRFPRPKTFLYLMSLRTGTELISLTLLINKLTGLYGLLAPLTGFHLSPLQLSMYIYSIGALAVTTLLVPHIRRGPQSPFHILALAWLYVIDSAVNAAYTAAFGFGWFLVLAQHAAPSGSDGSSAGSGSTAADGKAASAAGSKMMDSAAGFTNPKFNVSHVDVHAEPADDTSMPAQNGELVGHGTESHDNPAAAAAAAASGAGGAGGGSLSSTILSSGSIASITTIVALWAIRIYFILVVLAYARSCLRQHIVTQSQHSTGFPATAATASTEDAATKPDSKDTGNGNGSSSSDSDSDPQIYAEDPFALGTPAGEGYRGALGRLMVRVGKSYWLGVDDYEVEDEEQRKQGWTRRLGGRFHERQQQRRQRVESGASGSGSGNSDAGPGTGVGERERRRRAGTGPSAAGPGGPWLRSVELGKMGGGK
ncbi:MAG: hypothetical protein M1831_003539 [Alyxoria varia]|nr:MAG: hypothetical protein M1831_003539 [Alyxoria varia]